MNREPTYPIKVVAQRTGLTLHAIRAWEKRYGAVRPARTETNRRKYSEEDLERLLLLSRLKKGGYNIGAVAGLNTDELEALLTESNAIGLSFDHGVHPANADRSPTGTPGPHLEACIEAMERMDSESLTLALEGAAIALTQTVLLLDVILPLLRHIGDSWHRGSLRPSQEHLATAAIRTFLSGLMRAVAVSSRAPKVVVTTPAGQWHEISAQVAALLALADGWRVVFLGANLPAEEIANAVIQSEARAVVLSIVYPADDARLPNQLATLGRNLPEGVKLFVGGAAAQSYARALDSIGAVRVENMLELRRELAEFRSSSPSESTSS